jgi:hypothetical protein
MVDEMQYEQALAGIEPTLKAVRKQREKQLEKWGTQDHDPKMWLAILGEEFGEVAKEIAETHVKDFDPVAYRKELLHTAAVALAAAQCLDDGIA